MNGRTWHIALQIGAITAVGWVTHACTSTEKQVEPNEQPAAAPAVVAASPYTPEQQLLLDEYKAEVEIGRTMAGRLLAFYGVVQDKQLVNYVNQVGNYVGKAGDYPDRRYMFAILDSDTVNAFACPGGYILVTKGTIKNIKNEAELAAILGHETAHVGRQHMFNTLKKMSKEDAEKLSKEAASRRTFDPHSQARERPTPGDSAAASAIAKVMTSASGAGLGILQAAKAGMDLMMEKGLDQKLEYEADREGVKYAVRAGYEPSALDAFLARLEQEKLKKSEGKDKDKGKSVMDKTHPSIPDRRKAIAEALAKLDASEITGAVLQSRFEGFQSRLNKKKEKGT